MPGAAANDDESGLITSDSEFDVALHESGYLPQPQPPTTNGMLKNSMNLKRDVSKTFKRMLTANHNRTNYSESKNGDNSNISTKYGVSGVARQDIENQTQISEIESKFTKKKKGHKSSIMSKLYKDEDDIESDYLEDKFDKRGD